ncbi:Protein transport protein S9 plasma membrane t-SNARE [Mycoemilia scoparia]|uniref:Protein transport protein S9 plasma membrane t-SNARE n=1 Tax=Mycoemilia scoparia TaxID=417184 RepID=A0A9W8A3T7_9FUNG|nr:Protein transport protein S9 plasma membrane t-SNARE [Mycoemilia scoparia]
MSNYNNYNNNYSYSRPQGPGSSNGGYSNGPSYSGAGTPNYPNNGTNIPNSYRQHEPTEEEEEFDIIRSKIMETKQESLASTRKTLGVLAETEDKAARTMEQLAQLNRAELNMDIIENTAAVATESSSKLRTLNKSIFHIHIGNPFTRKKRRQEELERKQLQLEHERKVKEEMLRKDQESRKRVEDSAKVLANSELMGAGGGDPNGNGGSGGLISNKYRSKLSQAERGRYTLQGDNEDPQVEDEIDGNLNMIGQSVNRLRQVAMNMNEELDQQNQAVSRISNQANSAHAQIGIAQFHLNKIK